MKTGGLSDYHLNFIVSLISYQVKVRKFQTTDADSKMVAWNNNLLMEEIVCLNVKKQ